MLERTLLDNLKKDLKEAPTVVLFGPRQVGKTTLVKQLVSEKEAQFIYLDMESPADKNKLSDPELFLSQFSQKTIVIDEVQTIPTLFPILRSLIDKERKPGRFLLLGSASPELIQHSSESLAGRVRYREMFPFTLKEVGAANQNKLWWRGGFPEAYLTQDDAQASEWLSNFIFSYSSRDLRMLGLPMKERQVTRLLQMLAHQHGQLLNYSALARSLGISLPTVKNALYYLEEAMLIRTLQPWYFNTKKRLVKSPKVFIRDPGMLHNLLFLQSYEQLLGHPQAGNSWEGFVIQQILSTLPGNTKPWFYRSQDGAEVDLLLSKGNEITFAIEVKLSDAPKIKRGHTEAIAELNPQNCMVITPTADRYPLSKKWMVNNLNDFLDDVKEEM